MTFFHWEDLIHLLNPANNDFAICWHSFDHCTNIRIFSDTALEAIRLTTLGLCFLGAYLFFANAAIPLAMLCLAGGLLGKLFFYLQDFQFMGNYHYIPNIVIILLLFSRNKNSAAKFTICLSYAFTSLIKFNQEWITGSALGPIQGIGPGTILTTASVFVILLELVLVWGLLSAKKSIFWPVFTMLTVFHIAAFNVVGYYFPMTSFMLLSIFVIDFIQKKTFTVSDLKAIGVVATVCLVLLTLCQTIPKIQPGDTAITGEGRSLALNVFDTYPQCYFLIVTKNGQTFKEQKYNLDSWTPRSRCEPLIFFRQSQQLCQSNEDISISLISRRSTDKALTQIFWIDNFCTKKLTLSGFGFNPWVQPVTENPDDGILFKNHRSRQSAGTPLCDLKFQTGAWNCLRDDKVIWSWSAPDLNQDSQVELQGGFVILTDTKKAQYKIDAATGKLVEHYRGPLTPVIKTQ